LVQLPGIFTETFRSFPQLLNKTSKTGTQMKKVHFLPSPCLSFMAISTFHFTLSDLYSWNSITTPTTDT